MSQAGSYLSSIFPPPGPILTLTGNIGTASPVGGNINIITVNSTPIFVGAGDTLTLDFALTSNLILGSTTAVAGTNNTGIGTDSLTSIGAGSANTAIGHLSGTDITIGGGNVIVGSGALASLLTGNNNTVIGTGAGSSYSSVESYNIIMNNTGTALDVGVIRIGTNGVGPNQQSECFIAGIQGVTVANETPVVINSVTGQLGVGSGGSLIQTITGNTGGPESPIAGNFNIVTANTTVVFAGSPATETLDFGASSNLGLGSAYPALAGGASNIGLGQGANASVTSGSSNVALGRNSLSLNKTGFFNTAVGGISQQSLVSGSLNTTLGYSALNNLLTGDSNISIGAQSGTNLAGAESSNIYIGNAGVLAESNHIRIGTDGAGAGQQNVTVIAGDVSSVRSFTAILGNITAVDGDVVLTSGNIEITTATSAAGTEGLISYTGSGTNFRFISARGTGNTFVGFQSGNTTLTTGSAIGNSALGLQALQALTTGAGNVAVGQAAGTLITTGNFNVALGLDALEFVSTGASNIAIGNGAGSAITTSSNNIDIGNAGVVADSGVIRIGTNATHTTAFMQGISGVTPAVSSPLSVVIDSAGQLGTSTASTMIWQNQTANFNIEFGKGYVIEGGAPSVGTLPTLIPSNPGGGTFRITAGLPYGSGWTIAQNAFQQIIFGGVLTTAGVGGSLSSTAVGDSVEIACTPGLNPAVFIVVSSVGNITIV